MKWFLTSSLANLCTRVLLTYALADATGGMIIMWANPIGWFVGLVIAAARYFQGAGRRNNWYRHRKNTIPSVFYHISFLE